MRLLCRSIHNHRPRGPCRVYELAGPLLFCCGDMADWWDILIGFGVRGHPRTSSREVNLFTSVVPQSNGGLVIGITEVRNCPWCGEPITVCRIKRRVEGRV